MLPRTTLLCAIAVTFCIFIAITISAAPRQSTSAIAEIRSVLRAQQDAWNRGDIDGCMNGYARSKSTTFISQDTIRRGWENVRDRYREKYSDRAKMGVLTFSDLEIVRCRQISGGDWTLEIATGKDRPHGRFTLIFRHLSEGWRIVHDHTSTARRRSDPLKELQR